MGAKTGPKGPWKMTEQTLEKLRQAFAIDATIEEASFYADINPDTYYRWKKANPELSENIERLRNTPILAARQTLATAVKTDAQTALKYLERKRRTEFATKTETDLTTGGDKLQPVLVKFVDQETNAGNTDTD